MRGQARCALALVLALAVLNHVASLSLEKKTHGGAHGFRAHAHRLHKGSSHAQSHGQSHTQSDAAINQVSHVGDPSHDMSVPSVTEGGSEHGVTAALISWKRWDNFKEILPNLAKHSFIKEVVVWNNNPNHTLSEQELKKHAGHMHVKVINSKENLNNRARYEACAKGSHPVCYFQDDDWVPKILDSLYASFLRRPHLTHTVTNPDVCRWDHLWSFFNGDLHAGFAYIGSASFSPKSASERFLKQLDKLDLKSAQFCGDVLWTTWMNELPVVLTADVDDMGELKKESDTKVAYSSDSQFDNCVMGAHVNSTRVMFEHLGHDDLFPTDFHSRDYKTWTERALMHGDKGIFECNINHWEYMDKEKFEQSEADARLKLVYTDDWQYKPKHPQDVEKSKHDFHKAVDGKPDSFFKSAADAKAHDFFGVMLNQALGQRHVQVRGKHLDKLAGSASKDGKRWESMHCQLHGEHLMCNGDGEAKHVRFTAREALGGPFEVSEVTVGSGSSEESASGEESESN